LINLEAILGNCGASLRDVVKVNVYLSDMVTFDEMNHAYLEVFAEFPPARISVGGVGLALGAAVEIDCIAYNRHSEQGNQESAASQASGERGITPLRR